MQITKKSIASTALISVSVALLFLFQNFTTLPITTTSELTATNGFNGSCYLARYPDVANDPYYSTHPLEHFSKYGQYQNRIWDCKIYYQSGPFDPSCYLYRYSDVASNSYFKYHPSEHYQRYGKYEGRIPGCQVPPSAIVPMVLGINPGKYGGAISTLIFRNKEFINIYDHGRQLQSAIQIDGYFECNNPTEAGSFFDGQNNSTSSTLTKGTFSFPAINQMKVETQMAFWWYPKLTTSSPPKSCSKGVDSRVKTALSNQLVNKTVSMGAFGDQNIIKFNLKFKHYANSYNEKIVYEFLTGYLNSEFSKFWYLNSSNTAVQYGPNDLSSLSGNGFPDGSYVGTAAAKDLYAPIIMSTTDDKYAMGVYVNKNAITNCGSSFHGYNVFKFNLGGTGPTGNTTNKWSLALEDKKGSSCIVNDERNFNVYLVLGNVNEVTNKLIFLKSNVID